MIKDNFIQYLSLKVATIFSSGVRPRRYWFQVNLLCFLFTSTKLPVMDTEGMKTLSPKTEMRK